MKKIIIGLLLVNTLLCTKAMAFDNCISLNLVDCAATANITEVKASHILVNSKEQALKIRQEICNGLSFEDAAKKYSKCPSKDNGGDLGYFGKGDMVVEFEKAAFALPIGEVSQPVKTEFGWHLIKVVDIK